MVGCGDEVKTHQKLTVLVGWDLSHLLLSGQLI
jgi:hypothetical protein